MTKLNQLIKQSMGWLAQMPMTLIWSIFFCISVLTVRMLITGQSTYTFLFWNLFLAGIPLFISLSIMYWPVLWEKKAIRCLLLLIWILFIPNAFYLVTDLVHLDHIHNAPKWYDIALIFSFAWSGLLAGVISLQRMELLLTITAYRIPKNLLMGGMILLISIGVYMGRVLRFNSWDLLSQPLALSQELLFLFSHPFESHQAWGTIILYSVLFMVVYRSFSMPSKLIKLS